MMYAEGELTEKVIGCIIKVHQILEPGFSERIYQRALAIELEEAGLDFEDEKEITVLYKDIEVGRYRLDLLIEGKVVIELKTVEELGGAHYSQARSYLKASGCVVALLVNFSRERADYRRVDLIPPSPGSPRSPLVR